jgi:glycine/serine hydroxymethyltransferase
LNSNSYGLGIRRRIWIRKALKTLKPKIRNSWKLNFFFSDQVDPATGLIDYDALEKSAALFKPKLIIAGVSCYARNLDYARFRQIADQNGSLLMADMAHVR